MKRESSNRTQTTYKRKWIELQKTNGIAGVKVMYAFIFNVTWVYSGSHWQATWGFLFYYQSASYFGLARSS